MKHYILGILLTAAFAFAQDASTDSASSSTGSATVKEPVEQTAIEEPVEQAAPERTPEGYRIIRISTEETKIYKDSVKKAQIEKETKPHDPVPFKFSVGLAASYGLKGIYGKIDLHHYMTDTTSNIATGNDFRFGIAVLIPLIEYNFAIRTGVWFNYTSLMEDRPLLDAPQIKHNNGNFETVGDFRGDISQGRLSIPLLIAMKTMRSPVMFDVGTQFSIPLFDKYEDSSYNDDLIDNGARAALDIALLIGGEVIISRNSSANVFFEFSMNSPYKDNDYFIGISDINLLAIRIGFTYNII